jgi:hypothetical protein
MKEKIELLLDGYLKLKKSFEDQNKTDSHFYTFICIFVRELNEVLEMRMTMETKKELIKYVGRSFGKSWLFITSSELFIGEENRALKQQNQMLKEALKHYANRMDSGGTARETLLKIKEMGEKR